MTDPDERIVDEGSAGKTLAAVVREAMGGIPWSRARKLCTTGKVRVNREVTVDPAIRLELGARLEIDVTAPRRRAGMLAAEAVVHLDRDVVVVEKPAGLLSVPFDEADRDTLVDQTHALLRHRHGQRSSLGVVQRLDKDTTGLLVFARNLAAKRHLSQQLREHTVLRRYVAIVHGRVVDAVHDTLLLENRGDGLRGSWGAFRKPRGGPPASARRSVTHVRPREALKGATLVECRLETGRQHQIRIHLSESGHPLVGEQVYIRDYEGPRIEAARPMLHAAVLGFTHPGTGEQITLRSEPPTDFRSLLEDLRTQGGRVRGG